MNNKGYQSGITLIEILISLLIGVFLLGGILEVFISSKQTYKIQENLSRLQENGRFALEFLTKDIQPAGFMGCNSRIPINNTLNNKDNFLYSFESPIEGFESVSNSAWSPNLPLTPDNALVIASPFGGSDIIAIHKADDQSLTVISNAKATSSLTLESTVTTQNLQEAGYLTNNSPSVNKCAIVVVNNCKNASLFQVSTLTKPEGVNAVLYHNTGGGCLPGNLSNTLGDSFDDGQAFFINTISTTTYYVRTNSVGQPSLYRRVGLNDPEEIVSGIENMQVLYGVDTDDDDDSSSTTPAPDGSANYYVKANQIPDANLDGILEWYRVVSVRITLTVRTNDSNLTSIGDGRIRRDFTTTIALRNRLP